MQKEAEGKTDSTDMEPEAGPSHQHQQASSTTSGPGYIPVPGLTNEERIPRAAIHGTDDLLGAFGLVGLYDEYVRPYMRPVGEQQQHGGDPKGKGKAVEDPPQPAGAAPQGPNAAGTKKFPKGYAHHVADLPGTYSNMRDHYLRDLAFNPDYQPAQIQPMDDQTLRNAFTLQPGITPEMDTFLGIMPKKPKKSKRRRESGPAGDVDTGQQPQSMANGSGGGNTGTPAGIGTPTAAGQQQQQQEDLNDPAQLHKKRKKVRLSEAQ